MLVVDDEAEVRNSVRLVLEREDYEVLEAENGEQAIEILRSADNPLRVDTIVCDLVITRAIEKEVLAYFRSQFPKLPVVVLTDNRDTEHAAESFRRGVTDYLLKPIVPEALLAIVEKAVNSRKIF